MSESPAAKVSAALPAFFRPMLEASYSQEDIERIEAGCDVRRRVTLRRNALLAEEGEVEAALSEAGIEFEKVPFYQDAFVITDARESNLWDLDLYKQGKIYLQSLSSMLPPLAVDVAEGLDILDMCAAPGGKTCQMAAIGGPRAYITACEMSAPRAEKLEYNLKMQGVTSVTVMRTDARRLDDFFRFDRILLDAPCSGSGTLRLRDPKMPKRFTEKLVAKSVKSQKALLAKALRLLKPNGVLVYSTCSVLKAENEDVVTACLKDAAKQGVFEIESVGFPTDELPLLPSTIEGAVTVCPTSEYEGFFVTRIKRKK